MSMPHLSLSTTLVAKPIDSLLHHDDNSALSFILREVATRVVAVSLVIFAPVDAACHLIAGILTAPLACLNGRVCHLPEWCSFKTVLCELERSLKFFVIALLTPLEVFSPDLVTQPLLLNHCKAVVPSTTLNDVTGLNKIEVARSYRPSTIEELQKIVAEAQRDHLKISMGGQQHSQGGQQFAPGGIYVDMRSFNQVLSINQAQKTITVQPGITWEGIQNRVNPLGLAVKVMQASNIFTVGGSLAVNVHGWDFHAAPLIETIRSMKILLPDGSIRTANREENNDLFCLAIGGMGLVGIIVEAEIELTENETYQKSAQVLPMEKYNEFFTKEVLAKPDIRLHYARFSISDGNLLNQMIAVSYSRYSGNEKALSVLKNEESIELNQFLLHLHRRISLSKAMRWPIEVKRETDGGLITRNNVMRPEVLFLEYNCSRDTEILQEYFIPPDRFEAFTRRLQKIVTEDKVNLQNVTVRYVHADTQSTLAYAQKNMFAFVLYINQKKSAAGIEKAKNWTQKMVTAALEEGGTYYLPYQRYPSQAQFRQAYPNYRQFLEGKKRFDPDGLFSSAFFEEYFHEG